MGRLDGKVSLVSGQTDVLPDMHLADAVDAQVTHKMRVARTKTQSRVMRIGMPGSRKYCVGA
jgi:hypothetical protein